jgi:hypothetical protein
VTPWALCRGWGLVKRKWTMHFSYFPSMEPCTDNQCTDSDSRHVVRYLFLLRPLSETICFCVHLLSFTVLSRVSLRGELKPDKYLELGLIHPIIEHTPLQRWRYFTLLYQSYARSYSLNDSPRQNIYRIFKLTPRIGFEYLLTTPLQ